METHGQRNSYHVIPHRTHHELVIVVSTPTQHLYISVYSSVYSRCARWCSSYRLHPATRDLHPTVEEIHFLWAVVTLLWQRKPKISRELILRLQMYDTAIQMLACRVYESTTNTPTKKELRKIQQWNKKDSETRQNMAEYKRQKEDVLCSAG